MPEKPRKFAIYEIEGFGFWPFRVKSWVAYLTQEEVEKIVPGQLAELDEEVQAARMIR